MVKKFKPDITEKSLENFLSRGIKRKRTATVTTDERPINTNIFSIPTHLLPTKGLKPRVRKANLKPENWIMSKQEPKLSRTEVLEKEKLNIEKTLSVCQNWSRAARSLKSAIKPNDKGPLSLCVEDVEDRGDSSAATSRQERKNLSKEFLETFFKKAQEISKETETAAATKKPRNLTMIIPKFASGVKPGSDEIVL